LKQQNIGSYIVNNGDCMCALIQLKKVRILSNWG